MEQFKEMPFRRRGGYDDDQVPGNDGLHCNGRPGRPRMHREQQRPPESAILNVFQCSCCGSHSHEPTARRSATSDSYNDNDKDNNPFPLIILNPTLPRVFMMMMMIIVIVLILILSIILSPFPLILNPPNSPILNCPIQYNYVAKESTPQEAYPQRPYV